MPETRAWCSRGGGCVCTCIHVCTHTVTHTHMHSHDVYIHTRVQTHTHVLYIYIHVYNSHLRTHIYTCVYALHKLLMYTQMVKNLPAMQRTQVQSLGLGWDPPAGWMQVGPPWMEGGEAPASDHRTWGIKGCRVQDAGLCIPLFWPQLAPAQADGVATAQVGRGAGGPGLAHTHRCLQCPQRPGTAGTRLIETPPPRAQSSPLAPILSNFQLCLKNTTTVTSPHAALQLMGNPSAFS